MSHGPELVRFPNRIRTRRLKNRRCGLSSMVPAGCARPGARRESRRASVLPLTEIRDLEVMRQIAVLLERENPKLHAKVDTLLTELAKFRSGDGPPTVGVHPWCETEKPRKVVQGRTDARTTISNL